MDIDASSGDAAPLTPAISPSVAMKNGGGDSGGDGGNRIQYAQKAGLKLPEYRTFSEGPSHEPIFRSTVTVNNVNYDSLPGFFNRKAAEQSAAEVALMEIAQLVPANETISTVHETDLCKDILQQYAQKMNYAIPSYVCTRQDSEDDPFICTVKIGGIQHTGAAARTKKMAEIRAARTALLAIQGQSSGGADSATQYIVTPSKKQAKEPERQNVTPKGKRKFMQKNQQVVNSEKAEAEATGDASGSNVLPYDSVKQEPPCNTVMEQPKKKDGLENNKSKSEHKAGVGGDDHDSNVLLHDAVMLEHPYDTSMAQLEEPRTENSGSKSMRKDGTDGDATYSNILLHDVVFEERPYGTAMVQPKEEPRAENIILESKQKAGADGDSHGSNILQHSADAGMGHPEESRVHDNRLEGEQKIGAIGDPNDANIPLHDAVTLKLPYDNAMLQHNEEPRVENIGSECKQSGQSISDGALATSDGALATNDSFGDKQQLQSNPSSTAVAEQ